MTRKIDLSQTSLWKLLSWRTMVIIAMLCFSPSMYAQSVLVLDDGTTVPNPNANDIPNPVSNEFNAYLDQLNQIDQSTPEGQLEYLALIEKINGEIIGSFSTMTPEEQIALMNWLGDNPNSPLMNSSSPTAQKFLILMQNNETTVTQTGNNVTINIPAPVYPEPTKSPYNDTFPLDPVK